MSLLIIIKFRSKLNNGGKKCPLLFFKAIQTDITVKNFTLLIKRSFIIRTMMKIREFCEK